MSSGEADAIKYEPPPYKMSTIDSGYINRPPCNHDPYTTYTIPLNDRLLLITIIRDWLASGSPSADPENFFEAKRILGYLGG